MALSFSNEHFKKFLIEECLNAFFVHFKLSECEKYNSSGFLAVNILSMKKNGKIMNEAIAVLITTLRYD